MGRVFVLAGLVALSVAPSLTAAPVPMGEPFVLCLGELASIDGEELTLTFVGVSRDNRCPKGVECIVAGAATVVLAAEGSGQPSTELVFDVPPGGSAARSFEDYEINIEKVEPGAKYGRRIEPEDYQVTVLAARP